MKRDELKAFLQERQCKRFLDYINPKGTPATKAFQQKLAWAKEHKEDASHGEEASFLLEHRVPLRKLLLKEVAEERSPYASQEPEFDIHAFMRNQRAGGGTPDAPRADDDEGDASLWSGDDDGEHSWSREGASSPTLGERTEFMPASDLQPLPENELPADGPFQVPDGGFEVTTDASEDAAPSSDDLDDDDGYAMYEDEDEDEDDLDEVYDDEDEDDEDDEYEDEDDEDDEYEDEDDEYDEYDEDEDEESEDEHLKAARESGVPSLRDLRSTPAAPRSPRRTFVAVGAVVLAAVLFAWFMHNRTSTQPPPPPAVAASTPSEVPTQASIPAPAPVAAPVATESSEAELTEAELAEAEGAEEQEEALVEGEQEPDQEQETAPEEASEVDEAPEAEVARTPAPAARPAPAPQPVTTAAPRPRPAPQPARSRPAPSSAPSSLGDPLCPLDRVREMAPAALLSNAELACIANAIKTLSPKVGAEYSALRIEQAHASGDQDSYVAFIEYHLQSIDSANPDYALTYAIHEYNKRGASRAAMRWVKTALAHRTQWTGVTYETKVLQAYQLQASIAQMQWSAAENNFRSDPSEGNADKRTSAREAMGEAAQSWFSFARSIEQSTRSASQLCELAGITCQ